jgi:tetratricopeptide (TPR) repeat protein
LRYNKIKPSETKRRSGIAGATQEETMAVEFNVRFETSKDGTQLYLVRTLKDGTEYREEINTEKIEAIEGENKQSNTLRNPANEQRIGELLFAILNGDRQVFARALSEADKQGERLRVCLAVARQARMWPFELLYYNGFLSPSRVDIVRRVSERGIGKKVTPSNRRLRVLFMACSPIDVKPVLDFEREEDILYKVTGDLPVEMDVEDTGSLEGLAKRLETETFDVIHLSGHADINGNGMPVFLMEDDMGYKDEVDAIRLSDTLVLNPPRLVFLSGCRTGEAPLQGASYSFAERLVVKKMPAVLGWGLPVTDPGAIEAAKKLYHDLGRGKDILHAVNTARGHLFQKGSTDWPLLRLVADGTPLDAPMVTSGQKKSVKRRKLQHTYLKGSQVKILQEGFIGRRRQIQTCLRVLNKDEDKIGLLIHGTGGLGKSCLAGKLCERLKHHELIIIHGSLTGTTFQTALKTAFLRANDTQALELLNQPHELPDKLRILCNNTFQTNNYLILLDDFEQNLPNAQNSDLTPAPLATEVLEALLPALPDSANMTQLIITSRYQFPFTLNNEDQILKLLHPISPDSFKGADLGKKVKELPHINEFPDQEIRRQLITAGRGNPRLLEILDILIKQSPDTDLTHLLKNVANKQEDFIQTLMLRQIAASQPPEFNQFLRQASVFFAPVPKEALEQVCQNIPNWQTHNQTAIRLSLMEATQIADKATEYWLTPMLRQELFNQLPQETQLQCHQLAVKYYLPFINDFENYNPHPSLQLIEHALRSNMPDEAVQAGGPLLNFLRESLSYPEALHYGQAISSIISESKITGEYSLFWHAFGYVLYDIDQPQDAIKCYSQSLSIATQVFGEQHENVATILNNLGVVYQSLEDFEKAIEFFEQSLDIDRNVYVEQHPNVATHLNNLGEGYRSLGENQKAIEIFEQAIDIDRNFYGDRHPNVARELNNLGLAYKYLGKSEKAIKFYKQALDIDINFYGELHPNVALKLNNLGAAYESMGEVKKVIEFYEKAYGIFLEIYGPDHPKTRMARENLALAKKKL